jgi:hypothetical protein
MPVDNQQNPPQPQTFTLSVSSPDEVQRNPGQIER